MSVGDDHSVRPPDPLRVAAAAWALLAAAVTIKTLIAPGIHTVFPKFAAGALHWWSGLPLYAEYEGLGPFRYSPTFALLMTPFALPGERLGGVVWSWVSIAAYFTAVRRLAADVLPGMRSRQHQAVLLLLVMLGSVRGIWNAQSHALAAAAVFAGVVAVHHARYWRAGALLGVAIFIKLSPLAVALLLVAIRPRKLALPLLVALLAGALLPFLTRPPAEVLDQYVGWWAHLMETSTKRWPSFRDAWTVWEALHGPVSVQGYRLLQGFTAAAPLAWCLWLKRRGGPERGLLARTLAMGVAWLMLFGPAVEFAAYAWAAPLIAWGLMISLEHRRGAVLMLPAFLLTTLFGFGSLERALSSAAPVAVIALPAGTALFAFWLLACGRALARIGHEQPAEGIQSVHGVHTG